MNFEATIHDSADKSLNITIICHLVATFVGP